MGRRDRDHVDVQSNMVQWAVDGNGYRLSGEVTKRLPAGVYDCTTDGWGNARLIYKEMKLDELIDFPDTVFGNVINRIRKFWDRREEYSQHKFLHRMGYLFYGPQGCGKSSLVYQIINGIVSEDHICLLCQKNVHNFTAAVEAVRQVEPDRPMVCVIEDIDAYLARGSEGELLQWLDGADKTDHVVVLATTNYPERLDRRIVCRPRRFDRVIFIDKPDAEMRRRFFSSKLRKLTPDQLTDWTAVSAGLSFAGLAELILSVCCMGEDPVETAKLLKKLESQPPMSSDFMDAAVADDEEADAEDLVVDAIFNASKCG